MLVPLPGFEEGRPIDAPSRSEAFARASERGVLAELVVVARQR
jgi:hypothetical protein